MICDRRIVRHSTNAEHGTSLFCLRILAELDAHVKDVRARQRVEPVSAIPPWSIADAGWPVLRWLPLWQRCVHESRNVQLGKLSCDCNGCLAECVQLQQWHLHHGGWRQRWTDASWPWRRERPGRPDRGHGRKPRRHRWQCRPRWPDYGGGRKPRCQWRPVWPGRNGHSIAA